MEREFCDILYPAYYFCECGNIFESDICFDGAICPKCGKKTSQAFPGEGLPDLSVRSYCLLKRASVEGGMRGLFRLSDEELWHLRNMTQSSYDELSRYRKYFYDPQTETCSNFMTPILDGRIKTKKLTGGMRKMKLLVNVAGTKDDRSYTVDHEKYREENRAVLAKAFAEDVIPEEIILVNHIPEIGFYEELVFGKEDYSRVPLKCLFLDCREAGTSLCRFFSESSEEITPEKKADIYLSVMERFVMERLENVFGRINKDSKSYDVFYGNPKVDELDILGGCNRPTFRIELPKELVEKYYGSDAFGMEEYGAPRFFDLKRLSREEMVAYVIPRYYMELGMWDRKALRDDKAKMEELRTFWIGTLKAALA